MGSPRDLAALKQNQPVGELLVEHLYTDSDRQIVGAKFRHSATGVPIYLFQIETVPQVFMWVDTPADSNQGLAHALEHLLAGKGTKGRYVNLLRDMRLSRSAAATTDDFNLYAFSSGTGLLGFFEQFHAWLDALYRPDFADIEAAREFYHFGISPDAGTKTGTLVEKGSVYDEMQTGQGIYSYFFELNKRVLGNTNPFGFYSSGVPEEMRHVTPSDIRRFYGEHYHLSSTTGFIFALSPREDAFDFLRRVSEELHDFQTSDRQPNVISESKGPKYPILPSANTEIGIYPFPSSSTADRGEVRFGWKPTKTDSQVDLKLLQLFLRALADGDKSVLYKSMIDGASRKVDSGATNIESLVFLENSPYYPAEFIGMSGIAGNRMTLDRVARLRSQILATIAEISNYTDNSRALAAFNQLVESYAEAWRRSQRVLIKGAPRFGLNYETEWKEYLTYLEMDSSFVRSLSEDAVWTEVEQRVQSGKNVWRGVIRQFRLLDVPYATASVPSPQLLADMERAKEHRIADEKRKLITQFGADNEERALRQFAEQEALKTRDIDRIAARVPRPKFANHPPLTPDDDIRYNEFRIGAVPVVAALFDRAPTIDLGLSFDLRGIPLKYYKYLPVLPRCLDSIGLKTPNRVISYADLQSQTQTQISGFSVDFDSNAASRRADFRIEASSTTPQEFKRALGVIQAMIKYNDLSRSNEGRLRDVVSRRLWEDDSLNKGENDFWFMNPSSAFRYQDDALYLSVSSVLTRAHWDDRLSWLLHNPVSPKEIARLHDFAETFLAESSLTSAADLSERLNKAGTKGLEGELLEYWNRNIRAFPEKELISGLRRLQQEVEEDLKTGPGKTIADIRDLQRLLLTRSRLKVDVTLDPAALDQVRQALAAFQRSLPPGEPVLEPSHKSLVGASFMDQITRRNKVFNADFPLYVALVDPQSSTANMVFYADAPGYDQTDRESLLQVLSTKLMSGSGPHTFYTKTTEDGLAYASSITSDPSLRMIRYYAARTPDIAALVDLVNSTAATIRQFRDPYLIDYALQKTFPLPRSMATFAERGKGIARDLRDGENPDRVRRFYESMLRLRGEPELLPELTKAEINSIGSVLVDNKYAQRQREARSVFFFVGPENLLAEAERRLNITRLLRIYPSDFWLDLTENSNSASLANRMRANRGLKSRVRF